MPTTSSPPETPVFDWHGREHWAKNAGPCRYCGRPTHLLDVEGEHAHKVHAEEAAARTADRFRSGRLI